LKKFINESENSPESAIRKGFTVPEGAVNLAWVKSPRLTPKNNIIFIDTTKASSGNSTTNIGIKKLAYANGLGILEDSNGNQVWDEEYPVISDVLLMNDQEIIYATEYDEKNVLPYLHVSRYFHVDVAGIAFDTLSEYISDEIKVLDKDGREYTDLENNKLYKVFLSQPNNIKSSYEERNILYRVYIFLDINPDYQELYVKYNKAELSENGVIKNQQISFKETINPRRYFEYLPEETDVVDQSNYKNKVYSSKPALKKEQIIGKTGSSSFGWKYHVPKKAIPDPRIFQAFQWRLACEFTESAAQSPETNTLDTTAYINVGVLIPSNGDYSSTKANYLFYQLNVSDYNISGMKFINPMKSNNEDQQVASYWHVDLDLLSDDDLKKFDILLLAPSSDFDMSPYTQKLNRFYSNGGTLIIETSATSTIQNAIGSPSFSPALPNQTSDEYSDYVTTESIRLVDLTPDDQTDTFDRIEAWNEWPPNVSDIINNYRDTGSILKDGSIYSGWNLSDIEVQKISAYEKSTFSKIQYLNGFSSSEQVSSGSTQNFVAVLEATSSELDEYKPVMIHSKNSNGGNLFISTACIFEDHILDVSAMKKAVSIDENNGNPQTINPQTGEGLIYYSSQQLPDIRPQSIGISNATYKALCSSEMMAAEMKLRMNLVLFSLINKPANNRAQSTLTQSNYRLTTIYTDWLSSWVINGDVLSDEEKQTYGFILQTESPIEVESVWKRALSNKTIKDLIDEKAKQSLDTEHLILLTNRKYHLITTNSVVKTTRPNEINELSYPFAWTKVGSPSLKVPVHFGTYVVKHEMGNSLSYVENQQEFPSRPFTCYSTLTSMQTSTSAIGTSVSVTLNGVFDYEGINPGTTETNNTEEVDLNWSIAGSNQLDISSKRYQGNWRNPVGIETFTDENYYNKIPTNFPYIGFHGRLYHVSSTIATMVYQILNKTFKYTFSAAKPTDGSAYMITPEGKIVTDSKQVAATKAAAESAAAKGSLYSTAFKGYRFFGTSSVSGILSNIELAIITEEIKTTKIYSSRGKNVELVQLILNELIKDRQLSGPALKVDGVYGPVTKSKVLAFQKLRKAYWLDGIVDSETWSLLGYSLVGLIDDGIIFTDQRLIDAAEKASSYIRLNHISDGSDSTGYVRQSWFAGNSPSVISETFKIKINKIGPNADQKRKIHKLSITPWLADSDAKTVTIDYIHVGDDINLKDFKFSSGVPGVLTNKITVTSDESYEIEIAETEAECIILRMTQNKAAGWGKSKVLGLKEVSFTTYETRTSVGTPDTYTTITNVPFSKEHVISFDAHGSRVKIIDANTASDTYTHTVRNEDDTTTIIKVAQDQIRRVHFNPVVLFTNPSDNLFFDYSFEDGPSIDVLVKDYDPKTDTVGSIEERDLILKDDNKLYRSLNSNKFVITYNGIENSITQNSVNGPEIGNGRTRFWTRKDGHTEVDTGEKTYGLVSKSDGVLLICDENGNPFGFPGIEVLDIDGDNIHYMNLAINSYNNDQFTKVGLYDINRKEFITGPFGYSEISYYDYIRRGPNNVYIAAQTGYSLDTFSNIPGGLVSVQRPYSWIMPVYGVSLNAGSKIQLEPMPDSMDVDDVWSIPIKVGTFTKFMDIPTKNYGNIIGYLNNYQGKRIKAFYNIPEATNTAWSTLFGRPYVDIVGEVPEILDDFTIKVKYGPILNANYPSSTDQPTLVDPWKPIFTVYKRASLSSEWKKVSMSEIKDYNLWKGYITFNSPITSNDSRLIKVDYTCERKVYNFKYDSYNNEYINLNPYINIKSEWINNPLYVYIVPEYVFDSDGSIIEQSKTTSTVRITTKPYIFDANQKDYDPTALLIGVVYVSTSFDIRDLVIIDTRKRGGGISAYEEDKDMEKIQFEYNSYWDVVPSHVTGYQKGGFIIVRLPAELKNDLTTSDIIEAIDKNISAGVAYKVQDLEGNTWES
jgi:hypothetical protein